MIDLTPVVYEALGLKEDGHAIGTFRVIDTAPEVIDAVVDEYLSEIWEELEEAEQECDRRDEEYIAYREEHYFLKYDRYVHILKNANSLERRGHYDAEVDYLLDSKTYATKPTREAWLQYLSHANPDFFKF